MTSATWVNKSLKSCGSPLASGSFGTVYKAQHTVDKEYYAVKLIPLVKLAKSEEDFDKILREVRLLQKVGSSFVIKYNQCWIENNSTFSGDETSSDESSSYSSGQRDMKLSPFGPTLYIQMEYCADGTLRQWLDNCPSLESRKDSAMTIIDHIATGLRHISEMGIIHRDLKPENIFSKGRDTWKIGDFGLATSSWGERLTTHGDEGNAHISRSPSIAGTWSYMSPEMENGGNITNSSDVFSLGLVVLEILYIFEDSGSRRATFSSLRTVSSNQMVKELLPKINREVVTVLIGMLNYHASGRTWISEVQKKLNILCLADETWNGSSKLDIANAEKATYRKWFRLLNVNLPEIQSSISSFRRTV
ncbi:interferon-induced, double-stranded RNA-activated protein kinase [Folsomia candida]|uniref:interferon-induced, double-stranded RNA-activated protein kinase n=1 Tax=Folsomia candida TaxID=158441 RepID=UPI00160525A8|nr:interferon-induced, double-stranded RNA-activated protein kinase [Folsomia candida]